MPRCTSGSPRPASRTPQAAQAARPSAPRPPSATASRCPPSCCRARPTPSSRSARPTPRPRRSGPTAPPSPSTGSPGGHDGGDTETGRVQARVASWFDRYLKDDKGADTGPAFRVTRTGGVDSTDGAALLRGASGDTLPGPGERAARDRRSAGARADASPTRPAPARPPISALPGLAAGSPSCPRSASGVSLDFPGQYAAFDSAPLTDDRADHRLTDGHASTSSPTSDDAVLFGKVYDVGARRRAAGAALPAGRPRPGRGRRRRARTSTITPARPSTTRSSRATACAWSSPPPTSATPPRPTPATYTVSLKGDLKVPTAPGVTHRGRPAARPGCGGCPLAGAVIAAGPAAHRPPPHRAAAPRTRRSPKSRSRSRT